MILIDDLVDTNVKSECKVTINGRQLKGWQVAKPLNYDRKYTSIVDRFKMAVKVLSGRAIAVQFFEDLTDKEQEMFVKQKLK